PDGHRAARRGVARYDPGGDAARARLDRRRASDARRGGEGSGVGRRRRSDPLLDGVSMARATKGGTKAGGAARNGALTRDDRIDMLRRMIEIRRFEEKAAESYARGKIHGFLHLYIGQEAVAVGAISALRPDDYIVSHYREHGHAIARGLD